MTIVYKRNKFVDSFFEIATKYVMLAEDKKVQNKITYPMLFIVTLILGYELQIS